MSSQTTKEVMVLQAMPVQPISQDVLLEKYAKGDETTEQDIFRRVARGIAKAEKTPELQAQWEEKFFENMMGGAIGAGRIMSAAGTDIKATLANCFVQPVGDAILGHDDNGLPGIYEALKSAAETMRRGGGVGYDFSPIRPKGALVKGTASNASGPCSYMNVFDASCETVESAGARRGAQMGVLAIDHPDIYEFIGAKRTPGRWKNFNVSVMVTDAFIAAKNANRSWQLVHAAEPGEDLKTQGAFLREDGLWVYNSVKAVELWDLIMRSNYDYAEPGILYKDKINQDNNLRYVEKLHATNPCVTADTWVHTIDGPRLVSDLIGKKFEAVVDGQAFATLSDGFFKTGTQEVFKLKLRNGFQLRLTKDHQVLVVDKQSRHTSKKRWVKAQDLKKDDKVVLNNHSAFAGWFGEGTEEQGFCLGFLLGDGHINSHDNLARLTVWTKDQQLVNGLPIIDPGSESLMSYAQSCVATMNHRSDFKGFRQVSNRCQFTLKSKALSDLAARFGMTSKEKIITNKVEEASSAFYIGFLRGLFDADGSVQGNHEKGISVRLNQSSEDTLIRVQRMLARLGIMGTIYKNRRNPTSRLMPDGNGGSRRYACKANHELVISGENLQNYFDKVGFANSEKLMDLKDKIQGYKRSLNSEEFFGQVESLNPDGEEDVYDVSVDAVHAFDANGIYVHNCGEQPLPAYGCCDLGPILLPRFVINAFKHDAAFDFERLREAVKVQVRFLDNVLDVTHWPLQKQAEEAASKRRIGGGQTGLGNALAMLGIKYNSAQGRAMAAQIAEIMRDSAYEASIDLAIEKGPFPLFDADKYLEEGTFASRLPAELKERIRNHGIRNSHLLSVAPTGTVSLAFADNASNGIEPPFALAYTRKKRMPDGSHQLYPVIDHGLRQWLHTLPVEAKPENLLEAICAYKPTFIGEHDQELVVKDVLPQSLVTALEMSASDHLEMVAAIAPFIDSAISKTVNVPADYSFDDFKLIYDRAWELGIKGVATYRPNNILGSVLSVPESPQAPAATTQGKSESKTVDIDPLTRVIGRREDGDVESVTRKVTYNNSTGTHSLYVSVSFTKVSGIFDGREVEIERPLEVFIQAPPDGVPMEWVAALSRNLSLLARSGLLPKALQDNRVIRSDKGRVRYGVYEKSDGTNVPRFHESEVACIAYAIQEILAKRGLIDADGGAVPTRVLVKQSEKRHLENAYHEKVQLSDAGANPMISGKKCPECGDHTVIKKDGCEFCTSCGHTGSCG